MKARDHLDHLRRRHPLPPGRVTPAMAELARKRGLDPSGLAQALEAGPPFDPTEENLRNLLSVCPERLRELYAGGNLAAARIDRPAMEAFTMEVEPGSWEIVFHNDFIQFLFQSARAVALVVPEPDAVSDGWGEIKQVAAILAEFIWWCRVSGRPPASFYDIKPHQLEIADHLSRAGELFFLAHELGHIWCSVSGREAIEALLPAPPSKRVRHREEYLADGLALKLLLEATPVRQGAAADQAVYCGAEFALQLLRVMARIGIRFAGSHPSAQRRIGYLRELAVAFGAVRSLRRNPSQSLVVPVMGRLAGTTERIFDRILDRFARSSVTSRATDPEIQRLTPRIEDLFDQASIYGRLDEGGLRAFISQLRTYADPGVLLAAAAGMAVQRSDLLAAPERLAETLTDEEIRHEYDKQDLILRAVSRLGAGQAREQFLDLLVEAVHTLEAP